MPLVAVAVSAASFASAATAFAASASFASGLAMVGSALSIVGTISGNGKLAALGGLMTLGGALGGGMANPFGGGESASAVEGATGDFARMDRLASAAGDAAKASEVSWSGIGPTSLPGDGAVPLYQRAQSVGQAAGAPAGELATNIAQADANAINAGMAGGEMAAAAPASTATSLQAPVGGSTMQAPTIDAGATLNGGTMQTPTTGDFARMDRSLALPSSGAASGNTSLMSRALTWAKENPELAKMALQGVGGFASGLFPSDKDKAMAEAYRQQTADARRKALWAQGRTA